MKEIAGIIDYGVDTVKTIQRHYRETRKLTSVSADDLTVPEFDADGNPDGPAWPHPYGFTDPDAHRS